ncbi:HAMP domain-containing protein OS=Bosea thiooxidans OX=53254 GN=SAMN05660750_00629 PE=3 SV=1 [Bosea thiooxidans]|uniref:HAMP domain-containing protein n=4 Tax=Bosea thiooxidans TaxID=53254 RepID=A0A1T5B0J9_9HYPH|nr:methyl-accepting chemotaxis protein [Bosea thiooxidans]SKB40746.1 HAMP domain-containing protein [Bosea thiooxidans]
MKFFPSSIQNYLVATMACLCVPGIGALAYMAEQSFMEVRTNMRLAELVEADKALLLTGNMIRTARGQAQTSIQAVDDPAPLLKRIEEASRTQIAEAIAQLRDTDLPNREELIAGIQQEQKLTDARMADLHAEAAKPKPQRSLAATMPWYNGIGAIEAAIVKASDETSNAARLADPVLADLQAFKSAGWDVRSHYGTQCSVLRPAFGSGKALDAAQLRRLGELRGTSNAARDTLKQLASRPGVGSDLVRKIGVMSAEVEASNRRMDDLIGKLGQNAEPVIAAEDWTKQCNAPFEAIVSAVTQSLDDMITRTGEKLTHAWIKLGIVGSLLAALLVICVLSWRGVQRRIARPLVSLKSALDGMQNGDFAQAIPPAPSPDEIGALSRALETYRENALALEQNRRDRELAMLADAEQAAHVQKLLGEVAGIVAAARDGNFSGQAQVGDMEGPLKELVEGINEINVVVDTATTEFAGALSAIAGGDLTRRVETGYRGRFADLKGAINETVDRLSATVATIQTTSADVGLAAREIHMGADDLSKRTEEQASSLEETAATTEELAASVKASAQASKDAARIADEAMQAAENGGAIAGQAVEAMARIESASQKISDIIRVIDDIAFQTNLLALNAAVEAARAGEAGKGFAVVASEVRTLAQRSGEAAKDISGLISSSNAEVGEGVKLVRQAGDQLSRILAASQKVAATIADISAASGEQANGIDEMSQAVAHLDEMTQQNAALAEESAASANALTGRIGQLNELVAAFRTGREAAQAAPVAAAGSASPRPAKPALRSLTRPAAAPASATAAAADGSEPERLRQLAQAAFAQSKSAPAPRKVANGRAQDAGWEEF